MDFRQNFPTDELIAFAKKQKDKKIRAICNTRLASSAVTCKMNSICTQNILSRLAGSVPQTATSARCGNIRVGLFCEITDI